MDGSVSFLQHELVGSSDNDRASSTRSCHSSDLDTLTGTCLDFLNQFSSEMTKRCNWSAAKSLAKEFNIFPLNVLDTHDFHFVKEVGGKVRPSISKDKFLNEKNIAAGLLDLLDNVEKICSLLSQDSVYGSIV